MNIKQWAFAAGLVLAAMTAIPSTFAGAQAAPSRPQGPCDIYAAAGDPCVGAHSTTRALYAGYNGPLYKVIRQSDGKSLDIGVMQPKGEDAGGYADSAAQDKFCANTYCWISTVYDQSGKKNHLTQAPRGAFSGPALGGFNNLPIADMAPITLMGHKVYGIYIVPGMGIRHNDVVGTAVDDQGEGQYWVLNGLHYNSGCCFDYGNAETDSRDDDNGTMEATYFGNSTSWYHGAIPGPWTMTDQENNLVGCANADGSNYCPTVPNISWRFVTEMVKGEPHHWASLGGDSTSGPLKVMFDGPRINGSYDPMRKQGAILLGNGGDNSNSSQGTFYEGAMTAANTFPTDATDQKVQANVVAAGYDVPRLSLSATAAGDAATGLQTFALNGSQDSTVTFTNTTGAPVSGLHLSLTLPKGWSSDAAQSFAGPIAPGAKVSATFHVTSGAVPFNGDLVANAAWGQHTDKIAEKVRNTSPVKINEFRAGDASNATNAFIELYNAGNSATDISNWTLTARPTQLAVFSNVKIPAGTKLAPHGFYLLGLSTSGLVVPAAAGEKTLFVRSIAGLSAGDTVTIGTGSNAETRKIADIGTAAEIATNLWQPEPDGLITIAAGATNVPVFSTTGFVVGQKIALGYGTVYPAVGRGEEKYEIATVTAVGKPGTQAYLGADATPGDTNLKVTSVSNITAGDKIRLDTDTVGHGIETVTVTNVGTAAIRTNLSAPAAKGDTSVKVRSVAGLKAGDKFNIGTPANRQAVTITAVTAVTASTGPARGGVAGFGQSGSVTFTPALAVAHIAEEHAVDPGTGLDLAGPLKFAHVANMPFAARGTGISFSPATRFVHRSDEPVQALGTGITLGKALAKPHAIDAVVQDDAVKTAGYQDAAKPDLLFGGPALSNGAGSLALRDAKGLVADSLNYGLVVDPWLSQGFHTVSGTNQGGCRSPAPGRLSGRPPVFTPISTNSSAGRFPDGADSNSNCNDFFTQGSTILPQGAAAGATNIKVANVADFGVGETVMIGTGATGETATIASVGTPGASVIADAVKSGGTIITVADATGFAAGNAVVIGSGNDQEAATVSAVAGGRGGARVTLATGLTHAHAAGAIVTGTGITLRKGLAAAHASGTMVGTDVPTPGAPNKYFRAP